MVTDTNNFPADGGGPVTGDTEGEIDPKELFVDQKDLEFFEEIEKDWTKRAGK